MNDEGRVIWLTGLPSAGKTTVAQICTELCRSRGIPTVHLDGDILRESVSKDLGFSPADRRKNVQTAARIASLLAKQGITVFVSLISPYEKDRQSAKEEVSPSPFMLVHVHCPVNECMRRDVKGLYKKAAEGDIADFTGVSAPYEEPKDPDVVLDTLNEPIQVSVELLLHQSGV